MLSDMENDITDFYHNYSENVNNVLPSIDCYVVCELLIYVHDIILLDRKVDWRISAIRKSYFV